MLVIPLIKIKNGFSISHIESEESITKLATIDPVELATIFRGENFKTIHISILDDDDEKGKETSIAAIEKVIKSVDIPVQVSGHFKNINNFEELFNIGCYRLSICFGRPECITLIKSLLDKYSSSKIVVKINAIGQDVYDCCWKERSIYNLIALCSYLEEVGVKRILLSNYLGSYDRRELNIETIQELVRKVKLRITLMGGIKNIHDLNKIIPFKQYNVDSVVIGRALYENRFCCESLWRRNEMFLDDLGPTRRI